MLNLKILSRVSSRNIGFRNIRGHRKSPSFEKIDTTLRHRLQGNMQNYIHMVLFDHVVIPIESQIRSILGNPFRGSA